MARGRTSTDYGWALMTQISLRSRGDCDGHPSWFRGAPNVHPFIYADCTVDEVTHEGPFLNLWVLREFDDPELPLVIEAHSGDGTVYTEDIALEGSGWVGSLVNMKADAEFGLYVSSDPEGAEPVITVTWDGEKLVATHRDGRSTWIELRLADFRATRVA